MSIGVMLRVAMSTRNICMESWPSVHIPAVIMEPLLGGRLSNVPDHIVARLKQRSPENSVASWAFRFAGSPPGVLTVLSGMTYMEHLQDNLRTYSPLEPLSAQKSSSVRYGRLDDAVPHDTLQRLQILHALSVWY